MKLLIDYCFNHNTIIIFLNYDNQIEIHTICIYNILSGDYELFIDDLPIDIKENILEYLKSIDFQIKK